MAAVKRSLFLAPTLAIALGAGGFVSAAAAPSPPPLPPGVDLSSDAVQGLVDSALAQFPFPEVPTVLASKEVLNLSTVLPFAQKWRDAIARRDRAASLQAEQDYEAAWQAVEVYVNHRSLPLYTDIEVNTQFVIRDGLQQASPDWPKLLQLANHLTQQISVTIGFITVQPALSPLFDDIYVIRKARAQLLISSDALGTAPAAGDVAKARTFFTNFTAGFPSAIALIEMRLPRGATAPNFATEIRAAQAAAAAKFADPNATAADLRPLVATLNERYGYGLSLLNAAARTADVLKPTFTNDDKTALRQLNDLRLCLMKNQPCETGPGTIFAQVQPALENKARLVNVAATLRRALVAYNTATPAQVAAANKAAKEAVALAQQAFVGQFWKDKDLQDFLDSLPKV
jgi:hypothetical protein